MEVPYRIRMMVPADLRVIGRRALPSAWTERRTIRRHLVVPDSLRPTPRGPGSVWGVAMMRNEEDTAEHVLEHLCSQDVDALLVSDNGSTDGTRAILESVAAQFPLHIVEDRLVSYAQGAKMTILADLARRSGADWVVPFDADELWFAADRSVGGFLRTVDSDIVHARIHDVFPGPADDADETDPFMRLGRFDPEPFPVGKVAFRTNRLVNVAMGNLDVTRRGRRTDGLFIAHYPWRSFEQMAAKLRHGRRALAETTLPELMGIHWRTAGAWSDDQLRAAWDDIVAGRAVDDLSWSPIGTLEDAHPGRWTTWQDERRPEPV